MVMLGCDFGQVGRNDGHAGVRREYSKFAGHTLPTCGQKGGSLRHLVRRNSVCPNNDVYKNEKHARARQGLQAPC